MALRSMVLRDFVIVHEMTLEFDTGFTALTGETGAGKSILIDALQLALGARADAAVIREGATRTEVSADFDCPPACANWLLEAGFDSADSLLLRRAIDAQGKSRGWINGSPATAAQLRAVGDLLLDIHGQHAWQSLTRPQTVRALLDAYAGIDTAPLADCWRHWRQAQQNVDTARAAQDSLLRERERLSWQIAELDKLAPAPHEWDELNADHGRLSNAQALLEAAQTALEALEGEPAGALTPLARAGHQLREQAGVEPAFATIADELASSLAQAADAAHSLHAYLRKTDLDPERLAALDERMGLWVSLARRYRRAPADLPALLAGWRTELLELDAAADLAALESASHTAGEAYWREARKLSTARAKAAPRLAAAVTEAMQELGMRGGRFEVALEPTEPTASGQEDIIFQVAGHAGGTARPVSKVASGGELSRIALAIAVTTSGLGTAQTLIFDEVDAGVGGAVAEAVGRLMQRLGHNRQVLAVTHLAQVAACGNQHLVVAKRTESDGVHSSVQPVRGTARVHEIARMLGGERLSPATLAHAREMLEGAAPCESDAGAHARAGAPQTTS